MIRKDDFSRRDFIGNSAVGLAAALRGPLPARGADLDGGVRIARDNYDLVLLGNGLEVARLPCAAIGNRDPELPAEFGAGAIGGFHRTFRSGPWSIRNQIDEQEAEVFRRTRAWKITSSRAQDGDLRLDGPTWRSSIQVAELRVSAGRTLTADWNVPVMINLQPPLNQETESKFD